MDVTVDLDATSAGNLLRELTPGSDGQDRVAVAVHELLRAHGVENGADILGAILQAAESERAVRQARAPLVEDNHAEPLGQGENRLERRQIPRSDRGG